MDGEERTVHVWLVHLVPSLQHLQRLQDMEFMQIRNLKYYLI